MIDMLTSDDNKIRCQVSLECQLVTQQPLVIGVSGGPDSLCLLDLLHRLDYRLIVAHLDHQLRPESAAEAEKVRQEAQQRGLPFVFEEININAYAQEKRLSIEEAARTARYRFLFQVAQDCQAQAVAVGHTADDQVETVLMHLLRGAGLAGLRGMPYRSLPNPWSNIIPLVRPLLGAWRSEILQYLAEGGLQPNLDASNADLRYYRNRLRGELIPLLETYNPGVRQRLWQMAESLALDYGLVEERLNQAWQECLSRQGEGFQAFDLLCLRQQPEALQRHLLRKAAQASQPDLRDLDYAALQRGLALVRSADRSKTIDLADGIRLVREANTLWVVSGNRQIPAPEVPQLLVTTPQVISVPGMLELGNDWHLQVERIDLGSGRIDEALANPDGYQAWLDAEKIVGPLVVRRRQPGDRLALMGMGGQSTKVSDLMVNLKIPARARAHWPVVVCGDEIAWIPGLRLAERFRLNPQSTAAIHLKLFHGRGEASA